MIATKTERGYNHYDYECPFCEGKAELRVPVAFTEQGAFRCPLTVIKMDEINGVPVPTRVQCDGEFVQVPRKYGKPAHLLWTTRLGPAELDPDDHPF